MKKVISIVLILSLLLTLCACTGIGSNTKITIGVSDYVSTLDPILAENYTESIVADNCFEGLLRLNSNGGISLGGAVRYSVSGDNLTYTFTLNDTAKWYIPSQIKKDARRLDYTDSVTAQDYVFGINRYMDCSDSLENISVIEATDDYTLVIELAKPDIDFLYKLATLPIYPCNEILYNGLSGKMFTSAEYTPCNGPYLISEVSQSETVLERNGSYCGNLQIFNRTISLYTTGSLENLQARYSNGTYDMFITPSTDVFEGLTATLTNTSTVWGFAFNINSDIGSNADVRAALLSIVSPDHITMPLFSTSTAKRIIPDSFLVGETKYIDFNPQELCYSYDTANGLAAAERLEDGTAYAIDFAVPTQMNECADILVQAWTNLYGDIFTFNVITFEPTDARAIAEAGGYDLAILPLFPEINTAYGVLESLCGAPCFATREDFLKAYDTLPDSEVMADDFKAAEKYIVENGIFVPLFTQGMNLYSTSQLTGVYSVDGGSAIYLHEGTKPEEK